MRPVFFIAKRYLFAKKSHNVINVISIISAAGIAIGCAALVIILSVYNGFDSLIKSLYEESAADFIVTPAKGKVFSVDTAMLEKISSMPEVVSCCEILEENVFLKYGEKTAMATAKGVDSVYESATHISKHLVDGTFDLQLGSINQAIVGKYLASGLGVGIRFVTPLVAYFPSRTGKVSAIDPMASLKSVKLFPSGIVSIDQNFDRQYFFMPIEALRLLLEYENEVSCLEIRTVENVSYRKFADKLSGMFGSAYIVKDRYRQNESMYKLLVYEKLAIYLILLFIMLIIACNIFGSLKMLRIEKEEDIETLKAMGADNSMIKRIFRTEGWLISFFGIAAGVIAGLAICLIQQRFGLVKMPGNFIVEAYPVVIKASDILLTVAGVAVICGFLPQLGKIAEK